MRIAGHCGNKGSYCPISSSAASLDRSFYQGEKTGNGDSGEG